MRKIVPALAVAAVAVVAIGTPAVADEASGPAVQWAHSVEGDLGRIEVGASSGAGVTGLTAHIMSYATKAEIGSTTSFHLASGTAEDGVWESDEVTLPDLGFYSVNVEADDADGGHSVTNDIGTLTYMVQLSLQHLKTTTKLDYSHREYDVSGQVVGLWPSTQATAPLAGISVDALIPGGDFTPDVVSADNGRFSLSGTVTSGDAGPGYLSTVYDPTKLDYLQASADLAPATIKPAATRVSVHLDQRSIISGDPVTVTGDASWKSPAGWAPMANAPIAIGQCPRGHDDLNLCFSGPTTTTDAGGHFSYVVNPYDTDMIKVALDSSDPFVQSVAYASAALTVLMPSSFGEFDALRDPDNGKVIIGGTLELTQYTPDDTKVAVQFSKNGTSGWHTVDTLDLGSDPASGFGQLYDHAGSGYWRLTYAGVKGLLERAQTEAKFVS